MAVGTGDLGTPAAGLAGPPSAAAPGPGLAAALGLGLSVVAAVSALASYLLHPLAPLAGLAVVVGLAAAYWYPLLALTAAVVLAPFEALQLPIGAGALSATEAAYLLVATGYVARAVTGRPQVPPSLRDWPVIVLVASLVPGVALGAPPVDVAKLLLMWSAFYLVYLTVQSLPPAQLRRLLVALSCGAAALAVTGIYHYVQNGGAQLAADGSVTSGRASSGIADPNYYAAYLQLAAVPAFALAVLPGMRRRLLVAVAPLVVFVAILLSLSRGAALGLAVALLVVLAAVWRRSSGGRRMAFAVGLAALVSVFVVGAVPLPTSGVGASISQRLGSIGGSSSENNRLPLWSAAIDVIEEHPLLGVGALQFEQEAQERGVTERGAPLTSAHSVPLNMGAELGLLGLGSFLAWVVLVGHDLRRGLRRRGTRPLAVGLSATFLGFLLQGLTVTTYQVQIIWATVFLLAGVAAGLRTASQDEQPQDEPEQEQEVSAARSLSP